MEILSLGNDGGHRRRDSIIVAFQDAKLSVLEYDDSIHGLRTRLGVLLFTFLVVALIFHLLRSYEIGISFALKV